MTHWPYNLMWAVPLYFAGCVIMAWLFGGMVRIGRGE